MPIHFSIVEPRTAPPYDPMLETVFVKGTYSGAAPTKMWCVTGDGPAPGATHNPFEAGALEFMALPAGKWEAPAPAIAGDGVKHVRIWSIQPGSHTIEFDDREYSVQSVMPPPPPMPMAADSAMAKKTGKKSKSRAASKASSKSATSRTSQNGAPAKPAAKPAKRGSGKGKAAKPKAAAASRGKGRLTPAKGKPKAPKASKRRRAR